MVLRSRILLSFFYLVLLLNSAIYPFLRYIFAGIYTHDHDSVGKIINYLKELYNNGVKIVLFDEEFVFDCIKEDYNFTKQEINTTLCHGICTIKSIPAVKAIFDTEPENHTKYLPNNAPSSINYYRDFFSWIRCHKSSRDGLGESLAMLISYLFCSQPFGDRIIISDDRRMWGNILNVRKQVKRHYDKNEPRIVTTPTILCGMFRLGICTDRELLLELALCTKATINDNFKYFYLLEDGDSPIEYSGNVEELVNMIINPEIARILY